MTNLHEKGKYKQKVQYNFLSIFATLLNHIEEEQKPFIHPVDISDNTLLFLQKKIAIPDRSRRIAIHIPQTSRNAWD